MMRKLNGLFVAQSAAKGAALFAALVTWPYRAFRDWSYGVLYSHHKMQVQIAKEGTYWSGA